MDFLYGVIKLIMAYKIITTACPDFFSFNQEIQALVWGLLLAAFISYSKKN